MSKRVAVDDLVREGATEADLVALPREDLSARLPWISASPSQELPTLAEETWLALQAANTPPTLFRHGGFPARIETDDDGAPLVRTLTENRLRHVLARAARWYIPRRRDGETLRVPALPPLTLVRDMLARPDLPLPPLTRIVEAPIFAPDGTLQLLPGYHPASRTYYATAPGFRVPAIPEHPTDVDIIRARRLLLEELLGDFPFVGDAERAHAIALLLLPFVRDLMDGATPLHLIEKPAPGTGASLLADVLTFPALGRPLPTLTEGRDEEEWRKRVTAKLRGGPAVVLIDNLRRRLESGALSGAITATTWEDRIMGLSEMARVPVRCAWAATGNNPALSAEIARRTIRVRLDAKVDRPWLRDGFRHPDLRAWVTIHRSELVGAALTLGQAWIANGRPEGGQVLGMFEGWAKTMGGLLQVAGVPGFRNLADFYEESDAEGAAWRALVGRWWDVHQDQDVGVSALWLFVNPDDGDPLDLALGDGSERAQKTRFGKLLAGLRDRQFDGFRVVKAGTWKRAQLWRLVPVQGAESR